VAELLGRAYSGSRGLARLRYAASIPSPDPALARRGPLGGPRFALAGDAAGQVDAITGEGIHHALHAAALVAEALLAAGPLAAGARYEARWRAGPGRELALAARWARRWYTPRAVAGLLALGARSRRGRRIMGDLMTLRQPYATLLRRCARELVLSPSA
jgi:flavin-dependent dehydrogenase